MKNLALDIWHHWVSSVTYESSWVSVNVTKDHRSQNIFHWERYYCCKPFKKVYAHCTLIQLRHRYTNLPSLNPPKPFIQGWGHYSSVPFASVHLSASIFILLLIHWPERVWAIFTTSHPMQRSCFFRPAIFHSCPLLPCLLSFFLSLSTSHTPFCTLSSTSHTSHSTSHSALPPFAFLPLRFHLPLSGVQHSPYANNVPVLRKEAA